MTFSQEILKFNSFFVYMNTTIITLFFSFLMITLTIISLTVPNWFYTWVLMEIITALIVFFIIKVKSRLNFEAVIKFFLHQSIAAILLLIIFPLLNNSMHFPRIPILIFCLILYKIGMPPFHFWALQVTPSLDWTALFIFFTILKIPPLVLLARLTQLEHLWQVVMLVSLLSILLSLAIAINTSKFRVIILASSISSNQWVLASVLFSQTLGYMYLLTYLLVAVVTLRLLLTINQIMINSNYLNISVLLLTLIILTSSSIPPFCLFFSKLESIIIFSYTLPLYLIFGFILASSLTTVFYCNILININWQQIKATIISPIKLSACILLALPPLVPIII